MSAGFPASRQASFGGSIALDDWSLSVFDVSKELEGFKFTGVSKQQIMDGLRAVIQRSDVRFPDGPIRQEVGAFEYGYTGRGMTMGNLEDDRWTPQGALRSVRG